MNRSDRLANAALLAGAALAWIAVVFVVLNLDPRGDPAVLFSGALLLGSAIALTLTPMLWLGQFARSRRIAYRGDWWRAARRGLLVAFVVSLLVVLRGQGELGLPLTLFILAMAVLAEVTLSLRR
ncbi:MAG TPA: hypothetical protein VM305_07385 [Candidatus Limnocylindrales bacterium]|nr:hypothetical protein [Candidatus Limnocylindrales bacterium]